MTCGKSLGTDTPLGMVANLGVKPAPLGLVALKAARAGDSAAEQIRSGLGRRGPRPTNSDPSLDQPVELAGGDHRQAGPQWRWSIHRCCHASSLFPTYHPISHKQLSPAGAEELADETGCPAGPVLPIVILYSMPSRFCISSSGIPFVSGTMNFTQTSCSTIMPQKRRKT